MTQKELVALIGQYKAGGDPGPLRQAIAEVQALERQQALARFGACWDYLTPELRNYLSATGADHER
jgi:hypothetical protein